MPNTLPMTMTPAVQAAAMARICASGIPADVAIPTKNEVNAPPGPWRWSPVFEADGRRFTALMAGEIRLFCVELFDQPIGDVPYSAIANLIAATPKILEQRDSLARFKAYVHKRLDDAGIPIDPESPHKAEGCRIGGRLDELLGQREALLEACLNIEKVYKEAPPHVSFGRFMTDAIHEAIAAIARAKGHQSDPHHAHI